MADKPEKMTEEQLASALEAEFEKALGAPGGDIANERADTWARYLQVPYGDEQEGESKVVTSDVADVVDGIMPSLMRLFATADNLVTFDPVGEDDVKKAAQETDVVHYIFFKQNPAFTILYTWFFDALVQKNGIVKAWADEAERVTQETYEGLNDQELTALMDDPELEPVEHEEREEDTVGDDGVTPVKQTVHDIVFRRVSAYKCIKVSNVAPEDYRISADAKELNPACARFVGEERDVTRDELLAMGFEKKVVEGLAPDPNPNSGTPEKDARYDTAEEQNPLPPEDKSQQLIRLREGYLKVDFDGDGRSELRHVITANGTVLQNEIADRQPYHVLSPQPLPHKHFGRATGEKVKDVQRVTSELTRQTLNNLYRTNRPGHAVWEQGIGENTLDDLLTTRIGSIARFSRPVNESYQPMTVPFTAQASFSMLEYYNKAKRDRTGVSTDSQGLSPDALKNIQTTVLAQASDIGHMKIELIARIFGETGISSLFLHIHELAQKYPDKRAWMQLRNEWVQVDPSEWRTKRDLTVNIGMGVGTREQNLVHLNAIWDKQKQLVEAGGWGTLVTPMNVFNTAAQFVKNANFKNPEMFFTPAEQVAPQEGATDPQAQLKAQEQALAARQQQLDAERQQLDAGKLQLKAQEQALDVQRQRFDMQKEARELELEAGELARKRKKDVDDLRVQIEELQQNLLELNLKYGSGAPGAGAAPAQI